MFMIMSFVLWTAFKNVICLEYTVLGLVASSVSHDR